MYEIPWFKTETNIFSNRKIQIILKLPEGDTYFRVWMQLIALAVESNNSGRLEVGTNNPMTSIEKYEKYQIQNRERQRKYREKIKSENEKSNVIQTLSNTEEKNIKDSKIRKEENIREESENGFRQYKL